MAQRLTSVVLRRPLTTLLLLALATALAGIGSIRLRSGDFLQGHLPEGDPAFGVFQRLIDEFGGDQVVILGLDCQQSGCDSIFEPITLELVRELSQSALRFHGVLDVRSISTAAALVSDGATLRAERLGDTINSDSARRLQAAVSADQALLGALVSSDLRATAILVRFDPSMPDDQRNRSVLEMRDALTRLAGAQGFQLHVTGHVIRTAEADSYVRTDLLLLTPAMICLLIALLAWVFRDLASVVLALVTVAIPAVWSFGLMSLTDRPLTPVISVMPILILVIGITDSVHLLVRFHDLRSTRGNIEEVIIDVVREIGPPTTVTALTAALGFLSFLNAELPNLRDFGVLAAFGVLGAWFTTFTLLPATLVRLQHRVRIRELPAFALGDRVLDTVRTFAWKRSAAIVSTAGVTVVVCLVGLSQLIPDNDTLRLLGERDPAVKAERFLRHRLRPLDTIDLLYEPPGDARVTDPLELERLQLAEGVMSRRLASTSVFSILPILRFANGDVMNGSQQIPSSPYATSQLLLLAEAVDAELVHRFVTRDRRMARLSASYAWSGSRSVEADLSALRSDLEAALGTKESWAVTGTVALGARIGELVLEGQIASFSTAFLTIFTVLFVFLRSLRLGALGMLPNVLPVGMILAFMGFAGIYLDVGTAMIASILLGVSVDDTVYFLMHYQRARRRGAHVGDAIAYTFAIAGRPALFCSGSLAVGFFVLGFSSFQSLSIFGLLSGVAVLLAVATELVLMPAVLRLAAGPGR